MNKQTRVLQMAIEMLEMYVPYYVKDRGCEAINACKEALAEQPANMVTVPLDVLEDMQRRMHLKEKMMTKLLDADLYKPVKEWQSLTHEEFVAIAKSIWGDNLGMGDGYGYTVAWASSYATIEPSSKMLLLLQKIDEALKEKNNA